MLLTQLASLGDRLWYDANGNLLVKTNLDAKGKPRTTDEYTYNAQGRVLQWLAKIGGVLSTRTVYSYNQAHQNDVTKIFDGNGGLVGVFQNQYDNEGHLISKIGYDASHEVTEETHFVWKDNRKMSEEMTKPLLKSIEYTYTDSAAPSQITVAVRGKLTETRTMTYQWVNKSGVEAQ